MPIGQVLLRRRPSRGLLGGMTELPGTEWRAELWPEAEAIAAAPMPAAWRRSGRRCTASPISSLPSTSMPPPSRRSRRKASCAGGCVGRRGAADRDAQMRPRRPRCVVTNRRASLVFILATLGLDALGFGIVVPIVPALVERLSGG